jgi:hypothetical protein
MALTLLNISGSGGFTFININNQGGTSIIISGSVEPTPTPTVGPTNTPSPTPTITLTPTSTPTPTITLTPTVTPTPTITSTPTLTPTITPTITPSPTVTPTGTPTITPTSTPTVTPTPTITPTPTSGIVSSGLIFDLQTAPSSGTTWTDTSGNGYNATLMGSPSYTGSFGGGIRLNNATFAGTDYISVPYNINSSTVTIEIIASFNPTSFWGTIWGNESWSANRGYVAYMSSQTSITFGRPSPSSTKNITASNNVRQWIFVINGAQHGLYLNGTQVGTTETVTNQTTFATSELYFGARHVNNGIGPADRMNNSTAANYPVFYQMRLYNRALSGSEITQNYNAIKGTYGI